jgi:hypothetical protein
MAHYRWVRSVKFSFFAARYRARFAVSFLDGLASVWRSGR